MSAIEQIIAGYQRFRGGYYATNRARLTDLARSGQSPKIAVVACCDSRVDPAVITESAPGNMFVIRNVANLVPPCEWGGTRHGTSAALEFAVCELEVEHLIVLGHARCGGIRALMEGREKPHQDNFITSWMRTADAAREQALARDDLHTFDERVHACELGALEISLANLETFPWISERVAQTKLYLHGWFYDILTGELLRLDTPGGGLVPLA